MTYILSDSQGVNILNSLKEICEENNGNQIENLIVTGDIIYSPITWLSPYVDVNTDTTFETHKCSNLYNIWFSITNPNTTTILGRLDLNKLKLYEYLEIDIFKYIDDSHEHNLVNLFHLTYVFN